MFLHVARQKHMNLDKIVPLTQRKGGEKDKLSGNSVVESFDSNERIVFF
jgi:hypothetical protein